MPDRMILTCSRAFYLAFCLIISLSPILTFFLASILASFLASILTCSRAFYLAFFLIISLSPILIFFLASILAFFLASPGNMSE